MRLFVLVALVACKKEQPEKPAPEPTTPAPAPQPQPQTGPPTDLDNADSYDFGTGESAVMFDAAIGTYQVTCVGETGGGFLGTGYAIVGPQMALSVLDGDGAVFLEVVPDGRGDFADRTTDIVGGVDWSLVAQGEGPDNLQNYTFTFGDDGEISVLATDPVTGSVRCVDYASTVTLEAGAQVPAALTALAGTTRLDDAVDVTVDGGTISLDRGPTFDGVADFTFSWTGGTDLVSVTATSGDQAVTWPDGEVEIHVVAEGGTGNGGITLLADDTGLTGVVTDQLSAGS